MTRLPSKCLGVTLYQDASIRQHTAIRAGGQLEAARDFPELKYTNTAVLHPCTKQQSSISFQIKWNIASNLGDSFLWIVISNSLCSHCKKVLKCEEPRRLCLFKGGTEICACGLININSYTSHRFASSKLLTTNLHSDPSRSCQNYENLAKMYEDFGRHNSRSHHNPACFCEER